ncbi:MAG: hypothetical protein ACOYOK_16080, partial [Pseudobdellovibrionaceae bacterium]
MKKVLLSLITLGLIAQAQQAKAFAAVVGIASLGQVNVTEACRMEPDDLDMMSVMLVAPFSVLCYLDAHTNKTINYSAQ